MSAGGDPDPHRRRGPDSRCQGPIVSVSPFVRPTTVRERRRRRWPFPRSTVPHSPVRRRQTPPRASPGGRSCQNGTTTDRRSPGESGPIDHVPAVGAPSDDPVSHLRFHLEGETRAVDRHQFGGHRHFVVLAGGRFVGYVDVDSDRGLVVRIEQRLDGVGARLFHQPDHLRGGEDNDRGEMGGGVLGADPGRSHMAGADRECGLHQRTVAVGG